MFTDTEQTLCELYSLYRSEARLQCFSLPSSESDSNSRSKSVAGSSTRQNEFDKCCSDWVDWDLKLWGERAKIN